MWQQSFEIEVCLPGHPHSSFTYAGQGGIRPDRQFSTTEKSSLIPQHDNLPEATFEVLSPQQAAAIKPADRHTPNSHSAGPQPESLSLPLEQQQHHQQQSRHHTFSKSIHARRSKAPQTQFRPNKASLPQHFRLPRKRARPESSSSASARLVSARQHILHTASAADAMNADCVVQSAHQQAEALRSSARAVLGSLDWADLQLSCSTQHAAASASALAGMHSSGSHGRSKAGQVAMADGETGCWAFGAHPLHTQTASCKPRRNTNLSSGLTACPGQLQLEQNGGWGSRLAAAAGPLCDQSDQQCAAFDDQSWAVKSPAAQQQEVARGDRESSRVADSEATWSEGDDLHGSNPCLLPAQQVWCEAAVCT